MADQGRIFTSTGRKGRSLQTTLTLLALALVETAVVALVIALLTHGTLRVVLLAAWGTIPLLLVWLLIRRLRTRHEPEVGETGEEMDRPSLRLVDAPVAPRAPISAGPPAITLEGVVRSFGSFRAVDGLRLEVGKGEIYGFLGANGAGKTTTIQMMVGLLAPDAGSITIAGRGLAAEPLAARAAFGYVPDRPLLYDRLTGREFLQFLAQLRRIPGTAAEERIAGLLAAVELAPAADRLCGTYSLGMKRKLSLAAALLHRPEVLILDEPWNGLDPKGARRLKDLLTRLASEGAAVFVSTHDLATAEAVCHRVGILHRGRLVAEGSAAELRSRVAGGAVGLEEAFLEITEETPLEVAL